ncbi:peptidoglycan DD-metalloendopeptidase family protein [Luteitalea sp.]|jgi:flagellar protein FlgJ|uniref:peptidoglycan DD-metalloendopeptidase family protein n=1 Tax=Luteitalea sp. TaxID=2004800 RepID=UPI0037C9DF0C
MSVDARPTSISLPAPGPDRLTTLDQKATPAAEREKLSELAAQFESMLMLEMIKQMRKSLLDEGAEGEGLGNETYSSTIDSELALHLAKAGGMGLTPMMVQAWERQQSAVAPGSVLPRTEGLPVTAPASVGAGSSARAGGLTATPAAVSAIRPLTPASGGHDEGDPTEISLEMAGRVSSTYGWRSDPFKGQSKFHGGIDLAARYGTTVPAAAGGTVVTAQEQGGYGLTVVVRHANGFESRYAHLSSLDVKAGDTVTQGQQVGRVGSTGRSTGPHLHFEVMQAGRRVDPEQFVRNLTSDIKGQ